MRQDPETLALLRSMCLDSTYLITRVFGRTNQESITCLVCGMTSYHPTDVAQKYCANCHQWHQFMALEQARLEKRMQKIALSLEEAHALLNTLRTVQMNLGDAKTNHENLLFQMQFAGHIMAQVDNLEATIWESGFPPSALSPGDN